jgi:MtfA peptidase
MPTLLQRWFPRWSEPAPIPDAHWAQTLARCRLLDDLDEPRRVRLREFCARFLATKTFSGAAGLELTETIRVTIAALACLPVLELGLEWLRGWRQVIVYPGEFRVRREHHDEHSGVVTEGDDDLIGEAWEHGPLILSWADIQTDLEQPQEGLNVVIHEIAHKLDMLAGEPDGVPPLPKPIVRREWIAAMQKGYDTLCDQLDRDEETLIDPYASESPDEFFAVVSEMYFSTPELLRKADAPVHDMLAAFFRGGKVWPATG